MRGDKDEQSGEAAKGTQEPFAGITVISRGPAADAGFPLSRVEVENPATRLAIALIMAELAERAKPKLSLEVESLVESEVFVYEAFEEAEKIDLDLIAAIFSDVSTPDQPSSEPAPATSGEAKAHVSADFPPRAVVNADVDVLAAGLSSLAVETLGDEGRRRLVAAFRAVMTYDVTQDPVWEEISKLGRATRLYMCDPEPKSFVMEGARRITGRGSILVDYRAEILPGQERDVSVSVPARFHLHCRNGVPEIDRVELRD